MSQYYDHPRDYGHSSHRGYYPEDAIARGHGHGYGYDHGHGHGHHGSHHGDHHSGHSHRSGSRSHSKHSHSHSRHQDDRRKHNDPHHDRHLAEGAIAAAGIAEAVHHHRKKEGEDVSHGFGHIVRTVGAGALGAVAANEISRARDSHDRKHSRSSSRHGHRHGHGYHGY